MTSAKRNRLVALAVIVPVLVWCCPVTGAGGGAGGGGAGN